MNVWSIETPLPVSDNITRQAVSGTGDVTITKVENNVFYINLPEDGIYSVSISMYKSTYENSLPGLTIASNGTTFYSDLDSYRVGNSSYNTLTVYYGYFLGSALQISLSKNPSTYEQLEVFIFEPYLTTV